MLLRSAPVLLLAAPARADDDPLPSWNDEPAKQGWTVISMKNDWKRIFEFEEKP